MCNTGGQGTNNEEETRIGKPVSVDIAREEILRRHLVRIARDVRAEKRPATIEDLSGSGVLVQTEEGKKGILTAAHCITGIYGVDWRDKNIVILARERPNGNDIAEVSVALSRTELYQGGEEWETPDIAWIELTTGRAQDIEIYDTVFHRIGRHQTPRFAADDEKSESAVMETVVHGWFGAHERAAGTRAMLAQVEQVLNPQRWEIQENQGWDYADHVFQDKWSVETQRMVEPAQLPDDIRAQRPDLRITKRAGYSGGGIWRFIRGETTQTTRYALIGIMFAEIYPDAEGTRKLRAHRERSIGRIVGTTAPAYLEFPQPKRGE